MVSPLKVSIIIPALNEAAGIESAVAWAWQTQPHEVIVVDGMSTDDTADRARAAGALVVDSPRGRAVQQNEGAKRATGDVLLFLHADNWLDPAALGQMVDALSSGRVVAGAFRQRIEAEGVLYRLLEQGNASRARWFQRPYGDQGIFVRRETFEAVGGFPEVRLMEDVRLARLLQRRGRLVLLPGPLHVSARRWQRHGVIRQTLRNWTLLAAHRLGVSPDRLARAYRPHHADDRDG